MRVEVTVIAGEASDPALGFSKVTYILPPADDHSPRAHLMDVVTAVRGALEEATEAISQQIDRMGGLPE